MAVLAHCLVSRQMASHVIFRILPRSSSAVIISPKPHLLLLIGHLVFFFLILGLLSREKRIKKVFFWDLLLFFRFLILLFYISFVTFVFFPFFCILFPPFGLSWELLFYLLFSLSLQKMADSNQHNRFQD